MATLRFTLLSGVTLLSTLILLISVVIWFNCTPKFNPCKDSSYIGRSNQTFCNEPGSIKFKTRVFSLDSTVFDSITRELKYVCNQFIVDRQDKSVDYLTVIRPFLDSNGYKLLKTCPCGENIELWETPSINPIDVGGPPPTSGSTRPITPVGIPNFILDIDTSLWAEFNYNANLFKLDDKCRGKNKVKIAILDSGVELDANSARSFLRDPAGNWNFYNKNALSCCDDMNNLYGINLVQNSSYFGNEPDDQLGHGTAVNAVIAGRSRPNFSIEMDAIINNVTIFDESKGAGTLFDALCALHYAIKQEAQIVNMSWGLGYANTHEDPFVQKVMKKTDSTFQNIFETNKNILFIAGAGNDSALLQDYIFLPACLTNTNNNVLSIGAINYLESDIAAFSNFDLNDGINCFVDLYVSGEYIMAPSISAGTGSGVTSVERPMSGTSYAAPLISRMASVLISRGKDPIDIKPILKSRKCASTILSLRTKSNISKIDWNNLSNCLCDFK